MLHDVRSMRFGVLLNASACDTCRISLHKSVHVHASISLSLHDNCECAGGGVSGKQQLTLLEDQARVVRARLPACCSPHLLIWGPIL